MKKLFLFCVLCLPLVFVGCQAAPFIIGPVVTGVIIWKEGEAHKYYHEEPHTLYRATKLALKDLGHPIKRDEASRDGGYYITAGEKDRFKIVIRNVQPKIAEVKVRINFMGESPTPNFCTRALTATRIPSTSMNKDFRRNVN